MSCEHPTALSKPSRESEPTAHDRVVDLVRGHQAALFAYLGSLGCPEELAEDLVQETFVSVLRGGCEQRSDAGTRAWLRVVAKSRYLDHLRRNRQATPLDLDAIDATWQRFEGPDEGSSYMEALRACLSELSDRPQRALELHYRDGLGRGKVAEALGLSLGGVKSLLSRARAALRSCIERRLA